MIALLTGTALDWMHYTDVEPYVESFERLLEELDVSMIASTHGLPIADVRGTLPSICAGLRAAGAPGGALRPDAGGHRAEHGGCDAAIAPRRCASRHSVVTSVIEARL